METSSALRQEHCGCVRHIEVDHHCPRTNATVSPMVDGSPLPSSLLLHLQMSELELVVSTASWPVSVLTLLRGLLPLMYLDVYNYR